MCKRLLACGVQDLPDGTIITDALNFGFSADDTGDYLLDVLSKYERSFESIDFLSGDNCTANGSLATKITTHLRAKNIIKLVPLVGIRLFYEAPNSMYYALVNKVNDLMVELRTLKKKYKLAAKIKLNPVKRNDTRWGSTYAMIERCRELRNILPTCAFPTEVVDMIPHPAEYRRIDELLVILKTCHEVSIWLQNGDPIKVPLNLVRSAFDILITDYPILERHLGANSDIVHDKHFENAVVKVQRNDERSLTASEKTAIVAFKNDASTNDDADENLSYMERVLSTKKAKTSIYRSFNHVSATSNTVERLFSRAKLIMTAHRRCMDPSTLEALLMLPYNRDMSMCIL